jgi:hypothetical protein
MEESRLNSVHTRVEQKNVPGPHALLFCENAWRFKGVRAIGQLHFVLLIITDTILIQGAVVVSGHFIDKQTQVANSFAAFLCKLEVRVDVRFTTTASEWSIDILIVYLRYALEITIDFQLRKCR